MQISDNLGKTHFAAREHLSQKVAILFHPIHKGQMCVTVPIAQGFPVNVRMKLKIGKWVSSVGQQVHVDSAIPVDTERKGFKHILLVLSTYVSTSVFLYTVRPHDRISPLDLRPIVLVSGITAIPLV